LLERFNLPIILVQLSGVGWKRAKFHIHRAFLFVGIGRRGRQILRRRLPMIGVEGEERALGFGQLFSVRASGKGQTSQNGE
jgi:hypothetical protein